MLKIGWLLTIVVFMMLSGCSDERPIARDLTQDCLNHYRAESYKVATRTCTKAAEYGIVRAQWLLGHIYYYDLARQQTTHEQGFEWYLRAAEGGWPEAQTFVGESYMYADGVEKDVDKAFNWLTKAAEHHDPDAEFAIGMLFYNGEGRAKDISSAISWFRKAASKQHTMSINNLAWIHATSTHKAFRNAQKALFWAERLEPEFDNKSMFLDTQAAAHALAGEFELAVKLQNQAIALLPESIEESRLLEFQRRLESYQKGDAWQEQE